MADYKELLRRAISALPENNGAARRAVYEKARSALVGQLRAITPPLPARDITQHRLQLEDCIRQVEQEASEAVISLGRESALAPRVPTSANPVPPHIPVPRPAPVPPAAPVVAKPAPEPEVRVEPEPIPAPLPEPVAEVEPEPEAAAPEPKDVTSIEDIISQAAAAGNVKVTAVADEQAEPLAFDAKPFPGLVSRAEAGKSGPSSAIPPAINLHPVETPLKAPSFEPRREPIPFAANASVEPTRASSRIEPSLGNQAVARQQAIEPLLVADPTPVEAALSSVREVEVEPVVAEQPDTSEAEGAIERAIETLDREARGEPTATLPERPYSEFAQAQTDASDDDSGFVAVSSTPRSGAGLTIFLIVFAVLLAGAGGAGFWAWREGYVDLDQMFGQAQTTTTEVATQPDANAPAAALPGQDGDIAAGPGNTATTTATEPTSALEGLEGDDRLVPTPVPVVPNGTEATLPSLGGDEVKGEERLPGEAASTAAANDLASSVDPAVLAGSQSLLLEASADGRTGAVPFSGTVDWTSGVDDVGLPTLVGKASIPARNLGVTITIRKNSDPSLPASHLMEVDFQVSDTFIGGSIANLPGVLLKDQELVPGTPLVGASARVVGNSFLFALSASPADVTTNKGLLENRKWMDLAVVYGTGRNAIITLEKDEAAQALFDKAFAAW
ncbi:hypothetical protein WH87_01790 [Devosia epidermidihirudinis]|uniref:Uncharacterized protein n=1 Tax=Devosia epidermidihirudinis TaxID=1293439 RepID=A0A0F5QIU4_9HYPH|nr:hypothetical protein [Devosia epidermidihirudinis]KKC40917.1 hypothetical protein WH87_01790 [Devosia epidermidihirudinis]